MARMRLGIACGYAVDGEDGDDLLLDVIVVMLMCFRLLLLIVMCLRIEHAEQVTRVCREPP